MDEVKRRLRIYLILFLVVTISGTIGFMLLEDISFIDAFYYNIVTMSTVGYGDIHPTNEASRLFAVLLIIMGGGTFIGVIANATEILILRREVENRIKKVNMVLGVFFSETGGTLLKLFSEKDPNIDLLKSNLLIAQDWDESLFNKALKATKKYKFKVDANDIDLKNLSDFLKSRRDFLLGLLENPVFVEHENFSDTLLSVFHILDELSSREDIDDLPRADIAHLSIDINRSYKMIMEQWIVYMRHLKKEYPYLFSLAMRKNPFVKDASTSFK
jgi:hypothetical protein